MPGQRTANMTCIRDFTQSSWVNFQAVPQIRPQPIPSMPSPSHYSPIISHITLNTSLNKLPQALTLCHSRSHCENGMLCMAKEPALPSLVLNSATCPKH
jgi:hypothetical protein